MCLVIDVILIASRLDMSPTFCLFVFFIAVLKSVNNCNHTNFKIMNKKIFFHPSNCQQTPIVYNRDTLLAFRQTASLTLPPIIMFRIAKNDVLTTSNVKTKKQRYRKTHRGRRGNRHN